ncbi:MAG: DnaJ domain-containing protein [Pseudomonadales bacterium]
MVSVPLLHNHWFGKAVGGLAGLLLSPLGWAPTLAGFTIGLVCGAVFDRWASRYVDAIDFLQRPLFGSRFRPDPTRPSLKFTFAGMGRIARASGQVQPAHIAYAEHLMQRLQFGAADRRLAIDAFTEGKAPDYPFGPLAERCLAQLQKAPVLLDMILESLCRTTLIEDNPQARNTLYALTEQLGLSRETTGSACSRCQELLNSPDAVLSRAHETLGTSPELSDKAIRTAYRRQIARHHPDRLPADAPSDQKLAADRRMSDLREALDLILDARTGQPSVSRSD